jgi:hypothetical protein
MRLPCVIVATLCLCLLPAQQSDSTADPILTALDLERPVSVTACEIEDLDGDGTIEIVAITAERTVAGRPIGGEIVVLTESEGELRPVWRREGLNPWKLQIGDVDGDGPREIVCGVWKTSPFDPVMANRVFVYSWDGARNGLDRGSAGASMISRCATSTRTAGTSSSPSRSATPERIESPSTGGTSSASNGSAVRTRSRGFGD